MLNEECELRENANHLSAYSLISIFFAFLCGMCSYTTYTFEENVAKACFLILIISLLLDVLFARFLFCFIWSFLFWLRKKNVPDSYLNDNGYYIDNKLLKNNFNFNYHEDAINLNEENPEDQVTEEEDSNNLKLGTEPDNRTHSEDLLMDLVNWDEQFEEIRQRPTDS
jgi:hypothetical protein